MLLFLHLLQGDEDGSSPHDVPNIPAAREEVSLKQSLGQVWNSKDCAQGEKHGECFKGEELAVGPVHQGAAWVADDGGDAQGRLPCQ